MSKQEEMFDEMYRNASPDDIQKIGSNLDKMNRGKVAEVWDKVMALWSFIKDPNAPWAGKAIAIGALLYLVSPIDAVPDFIPVVGLADDVGVIALAVAKLAGDLSKYLRNTRKP